MKIIHIEDFFHPEAGYQINILPKYMVKLGHEVIVITSEMEKVPDGLTSFFGKENIEKADKRYEKETGVKIIRLPIKRFLSGRAVFKKVIFTKVEELKPDILYVHGNDTLIGIQYILRLKKLKYPLVLDSHMLEMASKNRFSKVFKNLYKLFVTPIIVENEVKVIRTQDDNYVERYLGIPLSLSPWISVGSDTLLFHPNDKERTAFREGNGLSNEDFVIIYTGKLDETKGGKLLATAFSERFKEIKRKIVLIVVGNSQGDYGREVEEIFMNSKNKILRFPTQKYIDLAKYYQSADLCIFPRQCSLSFFDAQACGLPVVAEDNNINKDRLSHMNGKVFKKNSEQDIREKIMEFAVMSKTEIEVYKNNATSFVKENFDYKDIVREYTELLDKEHEKFFRAMR
ncbi:glycosyltransferase family 4 protein [Planomicrobium sp. YIM 101495]|uniref:glycosyltransferase family 4 protein n=1 Tax=Planomicrobium sp. YIM 101495 TaxID=2665160 RepID=UPI0012B9DAE9|nr:glycosyltransferase family 4 protein [Planomicrobium sp. YIM 101495]MTD30769.1 glycosyltransferase [Planomicrobium sp. YIM 101495]